MTSKSSAQSPSLSPKRHMIGWREWVSLPDLGLTQFKAKIDTGARTSALHAVDAEIIDRDGQQWVSFAVPLLGHQRREARLIGRRDIKNTSGIPENRLVVETSIILGGRKWRIEVSLANRKKMEFELILGRTAIRRHSLLVDPGRSYLAGPPVGKPAVTKRHVPTLIKETRAPAMPVRGDNE